MYKRMLLTVDPVVTMKESSTYLFHIPGTYSGGHDLRACCSKFSINRLVMTAETGLPMATPSSCS